MENQSLPARSEKAFTLYSLYDATKELVADKSKNTDLAYDELVASAVEYWTAIAGVMPDWLKVRNREMRPIELRQVNISTHSVVLRALGGVGAEIMRSFPSDWKDRLAALKTVNWSKKNRDWENVCMVANSVVANRQARLATRAYLKRKLGIPESASEQRSIEHLRSPDDSVGAFASESSSGTDNNQTTPGLIHRRTKQPPIRPTEVRIGSAVFRVDRLWQIPVVVANWILKQDRTLPAIPKFLHETNSGFSPTAETKRLDNGWFIEVSDGRERTIKKGRTLLDACGFNDILFQVILRDGTVATG